MKILPTIHVRNIVKDNWDSLYDLILCNPRFKKFEWNHYYADEKYNCFVIMNDKKIYHKPIYGMFNSGSTWVTKSKEISLDELIAILKDTKEKPDKFPYKQAKSLQVRAEIRAVFL